VIAPDFLTEQEAADILGRSKRQMEYLRYTGRITWYDMRPPRYERKDVEEFRDEEAKAKAKQARWVKLCRLRKERKRAKREARLLLEEERRRRSGSGAPMDAIPNGVDSAD